jgi:protein involved in polysaccharide export with SLBB domain
MEKKKRWEIAMPRIGEFNDPALAPRRRLATGISTLAIVLALGAGCGPSDREIDSFVRSWETSVSAADYQVQPPDEVEISSAQAKEIDGEVQAVRQDGKITLRLLGDVKVAGMTPIEISRKLESLLHRYYIDPQVNVRLKEANSKQYYVFGQVEREGPFPCTGRDTLLSALALAQPNFIALKSHVKVVRPNHDREKRHVMTVDAERIIKKGKLEDNVFLQEGDIVYVPPTPLGWLGLKLSALFYPVQQTPVYGYVPGQLASHSDD